MNTQIINDVLNTFHNVTASNPLVHIIPSMSSANLCADAIAAMGGQSIMAVSSKESADITSVSDSVVISLGQPDEQKMAGIDSSLTAAISSNIPVVFDPVGAGFSKYRQDAIKQIVSKPWNGIIKGNMAEMQGLLTGKLEDKHSKPLNELVDFSTISDLNHLLLCGDKQVPMEITKGVLTNTNSELSLTGDLIVSPNVSKYFANSEKIFAITGECDYIISHKHFVTLSHKTKECYKLAGSGCIAASLCGFFATYADSFISAITGLSTLSLASYVAFNNSKGYGEYKVRLLDALSTINSSMLEKYLSETLTLK